jgi:hypothetical protein
MGTLPNGRADVRFPPMAAGVFLVVIVAVIAIVAIFTRSDSHAPARRGLSSARSDPSPARTDRSTVNDWAAITWPAPRGTDVQGFVGYPGARCNSANPAVALGRTLKSLVVICQNYDGDFYYKGLSLKNGQSLEADDSIRTGDRFIASNNGVQYLVSPDALIITRGSTTVRDEPMLEYWSV